MSTNDSSAENSIDAQTDNSLNYITGPHWELPKITNATSYWRCGNCGYESTHRQDLYRESFHAPDCEVQT